MIPIAAILFFAYAGLSVGWSAGGWVAASLWLGSLAGAFWLGTRAADPSHWCFWFCITGAAGLALHFTVPILNPNYIGCFAVFCLAIAFTYSWHWLYPVFGTAIALSFSRGAILAGAALTALAYGRRYPVTTFCLACAALVLVMEGKAELGSSTAFRLGVWQDTINHFTFFGHGFGSFMAEYTAFSVKTNATFVVAPHAYNDFLELVFELGIGTVFLLFLIVAAFETADAGRLVIAAVILLGFTYFPLSIPPIAQGFAFALGYLLRSHFHGTLASNRSALSEGPRHQVSIRGN